jgi:aspartyl-tRNA(Asn)/glutamyl-tRNA(Gln) amidotransferase subunit A
MAQAAISEDILFSSIRDLGARIRAGKVSPIDLTEAYLARLEKLGPKLGAVVTLTKERAMEEARLADKEARAGKYRGPLHGIPYGLKDLVATRGILTTWGAEPFRKQVFDYDGTVARKLRDAGAILVAKLAMVELAGGFGYNNADASFTGPCRTPWNTNYWSGGSSAGSGSAVAAGLVAFAIGSANVGLDHHAGSLLRRLGIAADLWAREPIRSHGAELDPGQARADVQERRRLRAGAGRHRRPGYARSFDNEPRL